MAKIDHLMLPNQATFIGCEANWEEANIVLFGAPFDSTTSFRPGARFAPQVIRPDSYGLETYSPRLDLELTDYKIHDAGDLELVMGHPADVLDKVTELVRLIVADNKVPAMIGGEHLVTLGSVRALAEKYKDLHVIHFDAHTDLRDDYLGNPLSHAAVIKRCWEVVGDKHIWQFGIRSGLKEEFDWAKTHSNLHMFNFDALKDAIQELKGKPVYFTLDLDVIDPAFLPGTGTPEPCGVSTAQLLEAIYSLSELNLVGFDVTELSPHYDQTGVSTAAACKILRELLIQTSANLAK